MKQMVALVIIISSMWGITTSVIISILIISKLVEWIGYDIDKRLLGALCATSIIIANVIYLVALYKKYGHEI